MAIKKKEVPPPSCPMWLATYGDLVTNMLVFFVLLVSMSEIKTDDTRWLDVMRSLQEAFGYVGGVKSFPLDPELQVKNADLGQVIVIPIKPQEWAQSPDRGARGQQSRVQALRRADYYSTGGKYYFTPLSATLAPDVAERIAEYAQQLRGHANQIEVRGHCDRRPTDGSPYPDHTALAFARARAVADALVAAGVERERIVVVAAGTHEPMVAAAYTPAQRSENDVVEVLQIDRRVDEFVNPEPASPPPTAP